jgi:alkanesulfonate monooxygenase SsuD/methylene tetrahydromethanopterin reductase-like flavin-dependent oxidoreductase (luciferase family)
LHFDFRNPSSERSSESLYLEILDLVVEAERLGFGSVWTAEHHFKPDGDTPSPLVLLGAFAALTSKIRIGSNLVVLPLHNPVRLAEDAATLAILSSGRFDLGVGAGYIEKDFGAFGQRLSQRPSLVEEGIELIRLAWSGEAFRYSGRRWELPDLTVSPVPSPEHRPRIFVGAVVDAAIERAARIGDGFLCGTPDTLDTYLRALDQVGKGRETGQIVMTQWWIVAEDPEQTWAEIGRHALYQVNDYIEAGSWGDVPLYENPQELVDRGHFRLFDGPGALREIEDLVATTPQIVDMHFYGLLPGESADSGAARMRYIADSVLPSLAKSPEDR